MCELGLPAQAAEAAMCCVGGSPICYHWAGCWHNNSYVCADDKLVRFVDPRTFMCVNVSLCVYIYACAWVYACVRMYHAACRVSCLPACPGVVLCVKDRYRYRGQGRM
eukprot:GHVU01143922.1.p4 GENE.GHVU01143922.1~~GHVU01143922.1.p4  ORF type:complete len:108 (-),score=4.58 GHVU01143922.1:654-977(-)